MTVACQGHNGGATKFQTRLHYSELKSKLSIILALSAMTLLNACGPERVHVLAPHGEPEATLMDFSKPFSLQPLPAGWAYHTFWTRGPMQMKFVSKDEVPALRFETRSTASMLFRHVDFDISTYPILNWRWYIEQPIESTLDERTPAGDDSPARLFLVFKTTAGKTRRMEIIWGNKLRTGDYKFIRGFPHYVADGGDRNAHQWKTETINLQDIYNRIWSDHAPAHLVDLAIFCDSDDTRGHTVSYFSYVRIRR